MNFELVSDYQPTGDQPEAIAQLTEGVKAGVPAQTLLGGNRLRQDIYNSQCGEEHQQADFDIKP